ncbi:hypothetical protein MLD38_031981 [Melastoma candidum]|uniref:Uncharacterized protein n=1 Tax=Melastoma candidum TaxID=119954 RepID=A0ACB9MT84_9MYRT|nr:hypothetical protein MLD38_031981 [Melastoma candidum]
MYPEEEPAAISSPTATRTAASRDPDESPSSPPPSSGCSSCFPCLDGARERGIQFSMKLREKSELIAGPKWKTFIRRFNRTPSGHHNRRQGEGRFRYDPLSYSLNFEEQNAGEEDEEDAAAAGFRNFSSRFAPVSGSGKAAGEVAAYD